MITQAATQMMRPEPQRDGWGRYMITPANGGKPVAHSRVTTFARAIADTGSLEGYWKRCVAVGMARRPDLVLQASNLTIDDKTRLKTICDAADEASGANVKRNLGTGLHTITEHVDGGIDVVIPEQFTGHIDAYRAAVEQLGMRRDLIEGVVVLSEFTLAGTFDRIVEIDGELYIADLKTGSNPLQYGALEIAVQLACYANADTIYNVGTKAHAPMPEVNKERALVMHLPAAGPAECTLHWVDVKKGWEVARLCGEVRAARRLKNLSWAFTSTSQPANKPGKKNEDRPWTPTKAGSGTGHVAHNLSKDATPPKDLLAQRQQWIRTRIDWLRANNRIGLQRVARQWPTGIPKPKDGGWDDQQIDTIDRLLQPVEPKFPKDVDGVHVIDPAKAKQEPEPTKPVRKQKPTPAPPIEEDDSQADLTAWVSQPADPKQAKQLKQLIATHPVVEAQMDRWAGEAREAKMSFYPCTHDNRRMHLSICAAILAHLHTVDKIPLPAVRKILSDTTGISCRTGPIGRWIGMLEPEDASKIIAEHGDIFHRI